MIALVQPFGLDGHGGGARILRSLLDAAPMPYLSVCTSPWRPPTLRSDGEVHLPRRPAFGRLESTRLNKSLARFDLLYAERFKRQLRNLFHEHGVTIVHAIPHGIEFWYAFEVAEELSLPFVLNVHDDMPYNLPGVPYLPYAMERLGRVWRAAAGRVVISEAMGREYNQRYGDRAYRVVTDGVAAVAKGPRTPQRTRLYMMGSTHLSYRANFDALVDALKQVHAAAPERGVSLTVRGGFSFPVDSGDVPVDVRPWGTQAEVERDLEEADYLYLPLPFEKQHESLVRYSMATKLVTYVGSGVPIVYHGPEVAAAGRLLADYDAAHCVTSLDPDVLAQHLQTPAARSAEVAANALILAREQFVLRGQQRAFWDLVLAQLAYPSAVA